MTTKYRTASHNLNHRQVAPNDDRGLDSFALDDSGNGARELFLDSPVLSAISYSSGASTDVSPQSATVTIETIISPETVTITGSGLTFINHYTASVTDAYRAAILNAEHDLQSHFINPVTLDIEFQLGVLNFPGNVSENNYAPQHNVSFATLRNALQAHATTPDDIAAVNTLMTIGDPTNGQGFNVPVGMCRILGIPETNTGNPGPLDQRVTLKIDAPWTFGGDVIGELQHEITEGAMGRIGGLGAQNNAWGPLDLFRYAQTVNGPQHDYTGGADGKASYFSVDGFNLLLPFHDSMSTGVFDGSDIYDWDDPAVAGDSFGVGGPGLPLALSATDLKVMDILGWTPSNGPQTAVFSIAALDAHKVEGSNGATTAFTFTISRTGSTAGNATVTWQLASGQNPTADANDFAGTTNGLLFFSPGDATKTITLSVRADTTFEPTEYFAVNLATAAGATIDQQHASAVGIIQNDDVQPDDYANSFADAVHPFGQVAVNGSTTGNLEIAGDHDWFRVQLTAGTTYVMNLQGQHAAGGTLEDPYLRLHNSIGTQLAENDDITQAINRDSRLTFTPTASGTYYLNAGAFEDNYTGSYTLGVHVAHYATYVTDFDGDLNSDLVVSQTSTGTIQLLEMNGLVYDATKNFAWGTDWRIRATTADFNDDGQSDLVVQQGSTGTLQLLLMDGLDYTSAKNYAWGTDWQLTSAIADFNDDGKSDIVLKQLSTGTIQLLLMDGLNYTSSKSYAWGTDWQVVDTHGDFNGDGKSDLVLRQSSTGTIQLLQMDGLNYTASKSFAWGTDWTVVSAAGDFNGDGKSDLVLKQISTGTIQLLRMDGLNYTGTQNYAYGTDWTVVDARGDFNGDGRSDLVWRQASTGKVQVLQMNDLLYTGSTNVPGSNYQFVDASSDFNGDGKSDLLLTDASSGMLRLLQMNGINVAATQDYAWGTDWHPVST